MTKSTSTLLPTQYGIGLRNGKVGKLHYSVGENVLRFLPTTLLA